MNTIFYFLKNKILLFSIFIALSNNVMAKNFLFKSQIKIKKDLIGKLQLNAKIQYQPKNKIKVIKKIYQLAKVNHLKISLFPEDSSHNTLILNSLGKTLNINNFAKSLNNQSE